MPVPLIALAYIVPGVLAAGAAAWEWLRPERDPEWGDKTVFNDRMRAIQSAVLNLNTALAQCKGFMANPAELAAWRTFRTNWQKYYAEVGSLEWFGPSSPQVANGKQYASQLVHWVDVLKTRKECVDLAPTTPNPLPPPVPEATPSWVWPVAIGVIAIALAQSSLAPARPNPRLFRRRRYRRFR